MEKQRCERWQRAKPVPRLLVSLEVTEFLVNVNYTRHKARRGKKDSDGVLGGCVLGPLRGVT